MPAVLPALPVSDHQYQLPEHVQVGRMYDSVILSGDAALRSLEDAWCEYARRSLL